MALNMACFNVLAEVGVLAMPPLLDAHLVRVPIGVAVTLVLRKFREAALVAFSTSGGGGGRILPPAR